AGDDSLYGGPGNAHSTSAHGSGADRLGETADAGETNTVTFESDISTADLALSRSGADLVVRIAGTNDVLTILGQYGGAARVQRFEFADGTAWATASIQSHVSATPILGTDGDDQLLGTDFSERIYTLAGND